MKPGDQVTIYQDPLTEQNTEGEAILRKFLRRESGTHNERIIERWNVEFVGGGPTTFMRRILVPIWAQ